MAASGQILGLWHIFRDAGVARVADGTSCFGVIMVGM
jgi:hypothetical protein